MEKGERVKEDDFRRTRRKRGNQHMFQAGQHYRQTGSKVRIKSGNITKCLQKRVYIE